MAIATTRSVTLSIALLLASTSVSHAGFIWLAPERSSAPAPAVEAPVAGEAAPVADAPIVLSPRADAAPANVPSDMQGRAWKAEEPVAVAAPVAVPPATETASLGGETISSQPIYSKGDQQPVAPVSTAPLSVEPPVAQQQAQTQPIELAPAPAPVAAAPVTSPVTGGEVILASSSGAVPAQSPAVAPSVDNSNANTNSTSSAMPNAEAMISQLPSMTAPQRAAAPVTAPVEVAASAPVEVAAPTAPGASATDLASAKPIVLQTVTAPEPSSSAAVVSSVTGETLSSPAAAPAVANNNSEKLVEGFGKSVPLVIALRQILPNDYGFVHQEGVDLTANIDWQGGRPWPQVLAEAIRPLGITALVSSGTVTLAKAGAETTSTASAAPVLSKDQSGAVLTDATIMQTPPAN